MSEKQKPLVSAAELEALIQDWGTVPNQSVDRFFPIRFWFLIAIAASYAFWLLFAPDAVARSLSSEPVEIARLSKFLYFRAWFLIFMLSLGLYAYLKNRYLGIIFSVILLIGGVNFVFDLFNVRREAGSAHPPTHLADAPSHRGPVVHLPEREERQSASSIEGQVQHPSAFQESGLSGQVSTIHRS